MLSDGDLLRRYLDQGAEDDFAALVQRHINLVYRAAIRRVGGNAHAADDVVQKVFSDLARKAASLTGRANLAGWLYTSTRFAAGETVRAEQRRRTHEQEARTMHELEAHPESPGERLDPVLDEVIDLLPDLDREAVLLHFFEGLPFREVGQSLSLSADATRMRVNRALERLRSELGKRGVASTAAALTTALSAQSAYSTPAALTGTVIREALAAGAPAAKLSVLALRRLLRPKRSSILSSLGVGAATAVVYLVVHSPQRTLEVDPVVTEAAPPVSNSVARVEPPIEQITIEPLASPDVRPPVVATPSVVGFESLSSEEKGVLKQLWAIHQYYGETPGRTIWFNVGPDSPHFTEFELGRDRLQPRGWISVRAMGGVSLNDEGRDFGGQYEGEIDTYPFLFKPPDGTMGARFPMSFGSLSAPEKVILKKLWGLEEETKATSGRRFVLNLEPDAPGFAKFSAGRDRLLGRGLVSLGGQKGGVSLAPAGRAFCEANREEIDLFPAAGAAARAK